MLDDGIKDLLEKIYASKRTPWNQIPLPALRRALLKAIKSYDMEAVELAEVSNAHTDTGIAVRIYRPRLDAQLPVLMYLHGGGWVTLDLDSHDAVCRLLAKTGDCIVVAVDYRLAPEHRFPAGIEDAVATFLWLRTQVHKWNGDPSRIGIGGDSAGANIGMAVCRLLESDPDVKPALQCLIYPVTDTVTLTESRRSFNKGYGIDQPELDFYEKNYLNHISERHDLRVSPLLADDVSHYPPTLIFTAGYDPLRDEGDAMAAKLEQQGVPVVHRCFGNLIHGFLQMGSVPAARAAIDEIAQSLNEAWRRLP
jgi:acetyl esterase